MNDEAPAGGVAGWAAARGWPLPGAPMDARVPVSAAPVSRARAARRGKRAAKSLVMTLRRCPFMTMCLPGLLVDRARAVAFGAGERSSHTGDAPALRATLCFWTSELAERASVCRWQPVPEPGALGQLQHVAVGVGEVDGAIAVARKDEWPRRAPCSPMSDGGRKPPPAPR